MIKANQIVPLEYCVTKVTFLWQIENKRDYAFFISFSSTRGEI